MITMTDHSRNSSVASISSDTGPEQHWSPYDTHLSPLSSKSSHYPYSAGLDDPRSSSQQSLRPKEDAGAVDKRTLLLVYIHGFLGNETSFQSFPAHVHNLLSLTLAETHVIHSKIYPRYKSRKNITFARDDFSRWLTPHESPTTDVILIGHSLGGILAAEVVLLQRQHAYGQFQHRILGQLAFDTPFLGMHPGVVGTGIASLFRPAPDVTETPEKSPTDTASLYTTTSNISESSVQPEDPNYNPAFPNDVRLANRTGKIERAWYFWNKHWGELAKASQNYITSHLEFGGCMVDYQGLRRRYDGIRALEDVDELEEYAQTKHPPRTRVRFVNYYTASTGRIKEQEPNPSNSGEMAGKQDRLAAQHHPSEHDHVVEKDQAAEHEQLTLLAPQPLSASSTPRSNKALSPRISLEEHRNGEVVEKELDAVTTDLEKLDTRGSSSHAVAETGDTPGLDIEREANAESGLPPLPSLPAFPEPYDASKYTDPDSLKLVQKEHARQVKAYERAKKERDKAIRDREKLVQKRAKMAEKQRQKERKEQLKKSNTMNPEAYEKQLHEEVKKGGTVSKQRDRKFCTLPGKDPRTGQRDQTWIRVYMEGMDEVVAHTSLFFVSETYAKLVGDTAERIEQWVQEDLTKKAVIEAAYGPD